MIWHLSHSSRLVSGDDDDDDFTHEPAGEDSIAAQNTPSYFYLLSITLECPPVFLSLFCLIHLLL